MIEILVGIPSSGKTTRAREFLKQHSNSVLISRDEIRAELKPYKKKKFIGNLHFEEKVSGIFNKRLCKALFLDKNIIIDNMNVKPRYIREILGFIDHYNRLKETRLEFAIFTNDVNFCISLNENREDSEKVPEDAIRKSYEIYKSNKKTLEFIAEGLRGNCELEIIPPKLIPDFCQFDIEPDYSNPELPVAYIFDVDGTLAAHNRNPYDYEKCNTDSIILPNVRLAQILSWEATIIILSGRPKIDKFGNDIEKMTKEWLDNNLIHFDHLYMRAEGDERRDDIVKYELYDENIRGKYNIMGVFDDRLRVISMWEELGIPVFNVNNGMGEY